MSVDWTMDETVRALVVCPMCRGELRDVPRGLLCATDALVFPVVDGTPYLVEECALKAEAAELGAAPKR